MEFKQLLDFSNATLVAIIQAIRNLGLDIPFGMTSMVGKVFASDAKELLNHAGISLEGSDVPSIANNFAESLKSIGLCQRVNILEAADDKLVVDIGECVFAPATKKLREKEPIPPCPMIAILQGAMESSLKKKFRITDYEYHPEVNASTFTLANE